MKIAISINFLLLKYYSIMKNMYTLLFTTLFMIMMIQIVKGQRNHRDDTLRNLEITETLTARTVRTRDIQPKRGENIWFKFGSNQGIFFNSDDERMFYMNKSYPHHSFGQVTVGGYNQSFTVNLTVTNGIFRVLRGSADIGGHFAANFLHIRGRAIIRGELSAKRIRTSSTGSDFVFESSYRLPTLEEVARYIKKHKHLPEIPSAKTMQKEGIDIGEMNTKLLQKIEELTLYLIEQNEKLKNLEKQNDRLSKEIRTLSKD